MGTRQIMAALAGIGVLICAAVAIAEGPQDELVGKWSGYRTARVGSKGERRVDHSFTITALKEVEKGKWARMS